ncbi:unnamed protein product [Eruca vesicaria subsp. sativa]|uniref:F-box domain-containing protein n=1 Tax=Eruca vesicaria subsp. sativa TaxID=29727 RepID=A0ABC8J7V3_ERUVS|nr:unnamed protein product [Eruca vesicaria subsp. sativa]
METLTEDLWMMVLAKLPIKIFTGLKLVCKQWKSVLESPFFRDIFLSLRPNPPSSSWSLMSTLEEDPEIVSHYQCDTWGLDRSLGSFIESFLADKQQKHKDQRVSVEAYSDVGLILLHVESTNTEKGVIYVANPVSRECVEIFHDALPIGFETNESSWDWGLVARTENGHLLDYKVVILEKYKWCFEMLSCLIYSSETGLWSLETLHIPHSCLIRYPGYPISLNGNLHWFGRSTDRHRVLISMDIYTTSIMGSVRCRVTPFPDIEKTTKFARACTPCQGFLMYMNIVSVTKVDGSLDNKLCVWRLMSEG